MKVKLIQFVLMMFVIFNAQAGERAMRILLVNDDGCQAPGITLLQDKLTAKGYDVWLVAPATNQSGVGSAITFQPGKFFDVKEISNKRYCFSGTPSDSLDFGLTVIMKSSPPDLVISGVNGGPNTGSAMMNSGTVSAAVRAIRYGYPAIAVSIGHIRSPEELKAGWPSTKKYWPDSVNYAVSLIDKLNNQWNGSHNILPVGSGLSVNYPALPESKLKGVKYVANEEYFEPQLYYKMAESGQAQQVLSEKALSPTAANNDSGWLDKGFITWTVIGANWNAPQYELQYRNIFK